jgi:hypothetical protein
MVDIAFDETQRNETSALGDLSPSLPEVLDAAKIARVHTA